MKRRYAGPSEIYLATGYVEPGLTTLCEEAEQLFDIWTDEISREYGLEPDDFEFYIVGNTDLPECEECPCEDVSIVIKFYAPVDYEIKKEIVAEYAGKATLLMHDML